MAGRKSTPKIDFSEEYDTSSLKGKSALITGAGSGIGQSIATGLAEAGAYVTIVEWNEESGQAVAKKLQDRGLKAQSIHADVTSWPDLLTAFKSALSFSPTHTIDIVIPNAGVASTPLIPWLNSPPLDPSTSDPLPPDQSVLLTNFNAVYNTALLALHYFKTYPGDLPPHNSSSSKSSKNIIFVGSMASYGSMTGVPNYGGSKFGVRGIFKALRDLPADFLGEGKPGVRFNMIAPSWIRSGMTANMLGYLEKSSMVVGDPGDCTWVVLRMLADENVKGRSASIIGEKGSFDLCDDAEGSDGTRELKAAYERNQFGYRSREAEKATSRVDLIPLTDGEFGNAEAKA
ncbi:NAD(P)-binding protein [Tothia fuscella]|uniref:NAD(P)-binding protein n=1 Tax=Tothia fuscella TaxID=1048955 RepID=A0A9P4U029_9PEZI|nr:NAD(P)-binding protein [Tothia fuscella]